MGFLLLLHGLGGRRVRHRLLWPGWDLGVQHHLRVTAVHLGRGTYWVLGWLLTLLVTYVGTQYSRSQGVAMPAVPGAVALVFGAALCGVGLAMARRFGRKWEGVLIGGLGIMSVGLGLANLVR